ncbi:MAG: hypothetical protein OT477_14100 [Chloroflexi bacterium]|nr:hypothetical protein [Chloroflexota bacterium]
MIDHVHPWQYLAISGAGGKKGARPLLRNLLNEPASGYSISRRLASGQLPSWQGSAWVDANGQKMVNRLAQKGLQIQQYRPSDAIRRFGQRGLGGVNVSGLIKGGVADAIVGGIVQGIRDVNEYPYLWSQDPSLAMRRIRAASIANGVNGLIGGVPGSMVGFMLGGPPGAVAGGVIGATLFDISPWGQAITQWVFKKNNANIPRNLRTLTE